MTHADVPKDEREARKLTDGLVRLSVGIQNPDDIITDLEQALNRVLIITICKFHYAFNRKNKWAPG
jgi:hypothetical protein